MSRKNSLSLVTVTFDTTRVVLVIRVHL